MRELFAQKFLLFGFFLFVLLFYNASNAYAQTTNCSLNIYPEPANGTNNYTVTITDNTSVPFVWFINNWWGVGDTIGNGNTGSINSRTLPSGWTDVSGQSYGVEGYNTVGVQQVNYKLNLTLNNGFGGIDIGVSSNNNSSKDLCDGHYSPSNITYNEPSSTPTPTPTPAPNLNIPMLKQTSNPWQSQVYDSANKWARTNPTINSWGCALTSAAMILKYHGINKLPNGKILDPGTLNAWLKSQKDGYLGTGWINWLALSRLSKLSKSINNITTFDALQYNRTNNGDKNKLTSDINNLLPDILEVPGHFIVAKGINGSTFDINDPYYNRSTLNDYSNMFLTLGTYTPSFTDLSYIMFTSDFDINITLKNSNNNVVGESFIQQALINDNNPSQKNSPIKIFYFPKPNSGNYTLEISSNNKKRYNFNGYFYNINGDVKTINVNGELSKNKPSNYVLNFDKNKLKNDKLKHKIKDNKFENEVREVED